jgi:hypothetical protein
MKPKMGTILIILACIWIAGGVWLFAEAMTFFRTTGWNDCVKANRELYQESENVYYVPEKKPQ